MNLAVVRAAQHLLPTWMMAWIATVPAGPLRTVMSPMREHLRSPDQ